MAVFYTPDWASDGGAPGTFSIIVKWICKNKMYMMLLKVILDIIHHPKQLMNLP